MSDEQEKAPRLHEREHARLEEIRLAIIDLRLDMDDLDSRLGELFCERSELIKMVGDND